MLTAPEVRDHTRADDAHDDGLDHLWCCNDNVSLCGKDITLAEEIETGPGPNDCVVCVDLTYAACRLCGHVVS